MCWGSISGVKRLKDGDMDEYWKYADILAMNCFESSNKYCNSIFATINAGKLMKLILKIPNSVGVNDGLAICRGILDMGRVSVNIKGSSNIPKGATVFISNHSNYLDFVIMFYVFKCGFLASSFVKKNWVGSKLLDIIPCLVIDRGAKGSSVEKIKDYLTSGKSLCIFPEGMLSNPNTLIRFRSGAFRTDHKDCPVIIKYKPFIHYNSTRKFMKGIMSRNKIDVDVSILPPQYPPFNDEKIEDIRTSMAKEGKFILSRVSNRGIKD
jgi:1-acyl-sn-glycerol-3-phosphate acyltransferase